MPETVAINFVYFEDCRFIMNFGFALSFFNSDIDSNKFAISTYVDSRGAVEIAFPSGITGCPVTVPTKEYTVAPSSEICLSKDQFCIMGSICSLSRDDRPPLKKLSTIRGALGSLKANAVATSTCRKEVLNRNETEYMNATIE